MLMQLDMGLAEMYEFTLPDRESKFDSVRHTHPVTLHLRFPTPSLQIASAASNKPTIPDRCFLNSLDFKLINQLANYLL